MLVGLLLVSRLLVGLPLVRWLLVGLLLIGQLNIGPVGSCQWLVSLCRLAVGLANRQIAWACCQPAQATATDLRPPANWQQLTDHWHEPIANLHELSADWH